MPSRMKLLSALRMPFTLNDASREVLIDDWRTPGLQQREIGVGAAVQRQVDDLLAADDLAAIARLGFEHARPGHLDRFADAADLQREVDALAGVDGDRHGRHHRLRESLHLAPRGDSRRRGR